MLSWQEECKKMPAGYVNLEFSNLKNFQEDLTSLRKIAQFVPVSYNYFSFCLLLIRNIYTNSIIIPTNFYTKR